jgi:hemerythrin-like domain-containing protein
MGTYAAGAIEGNAGMVNESKDATGDRHAQAAVEQHHAQMLQRMKHLTDLLAGAVQERDASAAHDAKNTLVEWCENELLPHALAEEKFLYTMARERPEASMLVTGMLVEHRTIVNTLEELRSLSDVRAAAVATALERLFALHLEKENRLLLPFIVEQPDLSLVAAVQGLHELTGELQAEGSGHSHTTTETRLD